MVRAFIISLLITLPTFASSDQSPPETAPTPTIEICFVLDTTGSMGGLIDGAKKKIWSIANDTISSTPRPRVKIALVPYRDRGDSYITKVFDLTDDIDSVYANLQTFRAEGGGDWPESVNEALAVATSKVSWSADPAVLKLIFLVGDAPPHMDYADDVKYPVTCQLAAKAGIVINTVECGNAPDTSTIWHDIAAKAEGHYLQVGQSGDMQVSETPMDRDLATTNAALNATSVLYGAAAQQSAQAMARMTAANAADSAAPAAAADRIAYKAKAAPSAAAIGGGAMAETLSLASPAASDVALSHGDLVDGVTENRIALKDVQLNDLPPEMQKMTAAEREQFIADRAAKRAALRKQLDKLTTDRDAYLAKQRSAASTQPQAFDVQVGQIINAERAKQLKQTSTTRP